MIDTLDAYRHEALDRTLTVQVLIGEILEGHPYITSFPGLRNKLTKIQEDLCELYQTIGNAQFEEIDLSDD